MKKLILAHYYTLPEVQAAADIVGDSLALSIAAAETDADEIIFAGVRFMGETAKILCPGKRVVLPDPEAGCSLADGCRADDLAALKAAHPDAVVVSYVNTSAEVKALTDICCTSSNALAVIRSIPSDREIIFAPDRNLGAWLKAQTGRENMILWDGACHVHQGFDPAVLTELRAAHPGVPVLAHPECPAALLEQADYVGSTAGIIERVGAIGADEYIIVTEPGILYELESRYPGRKFHTVPGVDPDRRRCNECEYMKQITIEKLQAALDGQTPEVTLAENIRSAAEKSIRNMLTLRS